MIFHGTVGEETKVMMRLFNIPEDVKTFIGYYRDDDLMGESLDEKGQTIMGTISGDSIKFIKMVPMVVVGLLLLFSVLFYFNVRDRQVLEPFLENAGVITTHEEFENALVSGSGLFIVSGEVVASDCMLKPGDDTCYAGVTEVVEQQDFTECGGRVCEDGEFSWNEITARSNNSDKAHILWQEVDYSMVKVEGTCEEYVYNKEMARLGGKIRSCYESVPTRYQGTGTLQLSNGSISPGLKSFEQVDLDAYGKIDVKSNVWISVMLVGLMLLSVLIGIIVALLRIVYDVNDHFTEKSLPNLT